MPLSHPDPAGSLDDDEREASLRAIAGVYGGEGCQCDWCWILRRLDAARDNADRAWSASRRWRCEAQDRDGARAAVANAWARRAGDAERLVRTIRGYHGLHVEAWGSPAVPVDLLHTTIDTSGVLDHGGQP